MPPLPFHAAATLLHPRPLESLRNPIWSRRRDPLWPEPVMAAASMVRGPDPDGGSGHGGAPGQLPEIDETQAAPAHLRDIPADKRYLVFIDDVCQAQVLMDAVEACPKTDGSRIIVTTSIQSVTTACSSGNYVYNMQCLSEDDSKKLFWRKVYGCPQKDPPRSLVTDTKGIFRKCGGLPLALISAARKLRVNRTKLESRHCKEVEQNLGLGNDSTVLSFYKEIGRMLMQCCDSLPDYDHRSCLLYLGIYPRGYLIKNKCLMRRLMAEGLVVKDVCKCFDDLIDWCLVEPVQTCSNSAVVKRCQVVHGVLLEYIILFLRVMHIVLENCQNKICFAGLEHFNLLLASSETEIVVAALETLAALVKINRSKLHMNGKLISCGAINNLLLSLAQGWGTKEKGLGLYSCLVANERNQQESLCLFPADMDVFTVTGQDSN